MPVCPRFWPALALLLALAPAFSAVPRPIFYLPLDEGLTAALAGGSATPNSSAEDPLLAMAALPRFVAGQVGRGFDLDDTPILYRAAGNFNPAEGACAFWLSPHFQGDSKETYAAFFGAGAWGMVYKYLNQTTLTFATAKPEGDLFYDCGGGDTRSWRPGEWHHLALCWSRAGNYRMIYLDGRQIARGPFPFHREAVDLLYVGGACRPYTRESAHSVLDELAIWDRALDEAQVGEVYTLGRSGRPIVAVSAAESDRGASLNLVDPALPPSPEPVTAEIERAGGRESLSLDGWWAYLPALDPQLALPSEGWGLARVPGYRNAASATLTPSGQATTGAWPWQGGNINEAAVSYYQRRFDLPESWRGRPVFLHLGGVDGLAEIFLNGERIGRLPGFEDEAFDLSGRLQPANTLTIALHRRSGASLPGFYDSVSLRVYPPSFVKDVVVRPDVPGGKVTFSCDLWSHQGGSGELELAVVEAASPGAVVRTFRQPIQLAASHLKDPALSAQVQRVETTFAWPDAHRWTYDDPFLYQVTARLSDGGATDQTPPVRFGYRTFEQRGGGFFLNGHPTHLRGHQIDLGWPNQLARLEELKPAGMNAFEFSAPMSSSWYRALPYRLAEFERFLNYADEQGLVAIPHLPDAQVLRERLFDPEIARLYRRRLDKHVRRFGNHPSVGLWYMHFNLAGYRWYVAPSLNDGSHQPADPLWRQKERYALEAQSIYEQVDGRPLYHHACGNLGDSFTANIYIGPNSPLQEREEWPKRWAETRREPLLAVEHGLMLIPYWFRYRDFPLEKVYASEPIFDEISAIYQGRQAYQISEELFDLYDMDRAPRPNRTRTLIQRHPGYQQVKSYFASRSLRSWRTYGITATIFNAENWDFKDAAGQPLPVMKAMARYFGDTDLYVAGPEGDWPSKDHAWFAGETIRKSVVLLNDLGRDLPVGLTWSLAPNGGPSVQQGTCTATARAGEVTQVPLQFQAPAATSRQDYTLTITPPEGGPFQPESFALSVWPKPSRPAVEGRVLIHDTEGRATAMLRAAGVAAAPLRQATDLREVRLVVVGRRSLDDAFGAEARRLDLEAAIHGGTSLLVLEQTAGRPVGLELKEQSTRQAFVAAPEHPFVAGLRYADLWDLRGTSDLLEAYPAAPPETEKQFPARFFKWGNRGVLASYVYTKPHLAGYLPVLECGFDLAQSPLLEGRFGRGRVALCQIDLTHRYGVDPVATTVANNLLSSLCQPAAPTVAVAAVGEAARKWLAPHGVAADAPLEQAGLVVTDAWSPDAEAAARRGATVLLLPGTQAPALGLATAPTRNFIAATHDSPLLAGLSAADLYFKEQANLQTITATDGWEPLTGPALLAVKPLGEGRVVACTIDPFLLGNRGQVKTTRFWSLLLANLGAERDRNGFLAPSRPLYVPNPLEVIPPYMNW